MKVAGGNGWQSLRSRCLGAIPKGSIVTFKRPLPLHEWRTHGAFRVDSCNKREIVLEAAGVDIGSALLSDAEHLLDKAAEHHATLRDWIEDSKWHSPGWSIVTLYYWSFFLGMAVTRLLGDTSWFLTRQAIGEFRALASSTEQPSAGALRLNLGSYLTATSRKVSLSPSKKPLHDAVWRNVADLLKDMFEQCDASADPLEYRLLWCFSEAQRRTDSSAWPSLVRNAINYLPGCGYGEVLRKTDIDLAKYLKLTSPFSGANIVSEFENHLFKITPGMRPAEHIPQFCRMLLLFTLSVAAIANGLHTELLARHALDRRWSLHRNRFLQGRGVIQDSRTWPYAD